MNIDLLRDIENTRENAIINEVLRGISSGGILTVNYGVQVEFFKSETIFPKQSIDLYDGYKMKKKNFTIEL